MVLIFICFLTSLFYNSLYGGNENYSRLIHSVRETSLKKNENDGLCKESLFKIKKEYRNNYKFLVNYDKIHFYYKPFSLKEYCFDKGIFLSRFVTPAGYATAMSYAKIPINNWLSKQPHPCYYNLADYTHSNYRTENDDLSIFLKNTYYTIFFLNELYCKSSILKRFEKNETYYKNYRKVSSLSQVPSLNSIFDIFYVNIILPLQFFKKNILMQIDFEKYNKFDEKLKDKIINKTLEKNSKKTAEHFQKINVFDINDYIIHKILVVRNGNDFIEKNNRKFVWPLVLEKELGISKLSLSLIGAAASGATFVAGKGSYRIASFMLKKILYSYPLRKMTYYVQDCLERSLINMFERKGRILLYFSLLSFFDENQSKMNRLIPTLSREIINSQYMDIYNKKDPFLSDTQKKFAKINNLDCIKIELFLNSMKVLAFYVLNPYEIENITDNINLVSLICQLRNFLRSDLHENELSLEMQNNLEERFNTIRRKLFSINEKSHEKDDKIFDFLGKEEMSALKQVDNFFKLLIFNPDLLNKYFEIALSHDSYDTSVKKYDEIEKMIDDNNIKPHMNVMDYYRKLCDYLSFINSQLYESYDRYKENEFYEKDLLFHFVMNNKKQTITLENPLILFFEEKISTIESLVSIFEILGESKRNLFIIAKDISSEVFTYLNNIPENYTVVAMKTSEFEDSGKMIFQDLKTLNLLGSIHRTLDIQSDNFNVFGLTFAERIVIGKDFITMTGKNRDNINKIYIYKK